MRRAEIRAALEAAYNLSAHTEYVVAGSLSVLGLLEHPPEDMSMSIDIDFFPLSDPERASDIAAVLGEDSAFHRRNGYYLDAISPDLPTLPQGWEDRLVRIALGPVTACFLDVHDTAVSKYARGESQDLRWLDAGYAAALLEAPRVRARMRFGTDFFDDAERDRAWSALRAHEAALLPEGGLHAGLLAAVRHQGARCVHEVDMHAGEYMGRVAWADASHLVQAIGDDVLVIHSMPARTQIPSLGEWVHVSYCEGVLALASDPTSEPEPSALPSPGM